MNGDLIAAGLSLAGLTVSVVGLVFLAIQVKLLRNQIRQAERALVSEQHRNRKQASLEFLVTTMERRRASLGEVPAGGRRDQVRAFLAELERSGAGVRELNRYLSNYEVLAVGVNSGALDIDIIDRAWGSVIIRAFDGYQSYIEGRRTAIGQSTLYNELETLARALRDRRAGSVRA